MLSVNLWLLTAAEVYWPSMVLRRGSAAMDGTAVWAVPALGFIESANCSPRPLHTAYTRPVSVLAKQVVNCRLPA